MVAALRWPRARASSAAAAGRRPSTSPRCAPRSTPSPGRRRRARGRAGAAPDAARDHCDRAATGDAGRAAAADGAAQALATVASSSRVEIDPPRSVRIERTIEAARLLQAAGVDAVNISDSAMARVRMGAMAVAFGIQHDLDLECLVHFTTRDRNLMALESELLGAHALGFATSSR